MAPKGLLEIDDCLDADGNVVLPPGTTLISLIERNVANVGDLVAYRYLDHSRSEGQTYEVTWAELACPAAGHRRAGATVRGCR